VTQPADRRFVMEPRLDAEVSTINDALATKVDNTDARLTDQRVPTDNSVTSAKIVNGTIVDEDVSATAAIAKTKISGTAVTLTDVGTVTSAMILNGTIANEDIKDATIESAKLAAQDYIKFDTTYAGGSTQPGMLAWDQDNETLEFQLDDHVTLQIGQEHVMRVKNSSGSVAIPERTVVMFAGATGDTITVAAAVSDGSVNVNYLAGITTEEIPADGFGFVTQLGFINQVNTNAWTVGTILYVDPAVAGGLTATVPVAPAWTMPVAAVTKQNVSAGRMLVRAIPGGSGAGGSSVIIAETSPAGGNAGDLWYDSVDGTLYVFYEDVDGSQWVQVQANSALDASIVERVGSLESQAIAFGAMSPNYIINGGMDIWQRGTSFTANGYTADRWTATVVGTCTHSRETSNVPVGASYAYKWTTGASSSYGQIRQFIESSNVAQLRGKTVTASAYVKISANFTGTLVMEIQYSTTTDTSSGFSGTAPSQVTTGTPNSSGYTRITSTFTVPNNAVGLYIGIVPTQAQISGASALIGNVQVEAGTIATTFRRNANSIQGELAACQRYYYKTYAKDVYANGASTVVGNIFGISVDVSSVISASRFAVPMRVTPSIQFFFPSGGAGNGSARDNSNGSAISGMSVGVVNEVGLGYIQKAGGLVSGRSYSFELTADAEL